MHPEGPQLVIEALQPSHVDELAALLHHPAVYAHIEPELPARALIAERLQRALAGPGAQFPGETWLNFLVRDAQGRMLGRLEATLHDGVAELAFLVAPAHWGRGVAQAALQWLHRQLAGVHGVRQCWATTAPGNTRSQALLARCGYRPAALPAFGLGSYDDGDRVFRCELATLG